MRETRFYRSILIIKLDHNYILISIMKNEFHKIVFSYKSRKHIYSQHDLLFFTI